MKIIVSALVGFGLFFGSQVFAQNRTVSGKAIIETEDNSAFESQRDHLATFMQVTENIRFQETIGLLPPCSTEQVVYGLASGISKRDLEVAKETPTALVNELQALTGEVSDVISSALRASECEPPAKNDKCCKKSAEADVSDACNAATNKYCKLEGIRIKGCTSTSDDC